MGRTPALLMVAGLVVLGGAGCGGSKPVAATTRTTSQPARTATVSPVTTANPVANPYTLYERKMQALGNWLNGVLLRVGTADEQSTATAASDATNLKLARRAVLVAAKRLAKIVPPSNVSAAHDDLRKAVLEYASELDLMIAAAEKGSPPDRAKFFKLKGLKDMTKASLAIESKGYNIIGPSANGKIPAAKAGR